jgi:hypothetical protein
MLTYEPITFAKSPNAKSKEQFESFVIGDLDWSVSDESLTLTWDGKDYAVDPDGFRYVIQYGLTQGLMDSYAPHTTHAKANNAFIARLKKIIEGTMSLEGSRTADPVRSEMIKLATERMCDLAGKSESALRKDLGKAFMKQRNDLLAKYESVFRKRAEMIVELRKSELDFAAVDAAQETEAEPAAPTEAMATKAEVKGKKSASKKAA